MKQNPNELPIELICNLYEKANVTCEINDGKIIRMEMR